MRTKNFFLFLQSSEKTKYEKAKNIPHEFVVGDSKRQLDTHQLRLYLAYEKDINLTKTSSKPFDLENLFKQSSIAHTVDCRTSK